MSWQQLFLIGAAGGLGAVARYLTGGIAHRWLGNSFPWGTLAANLLGCLLFGLVWAACEDRQWLRPDVRLVVLTGFMGSFTTFSTFAFETSAYMRDGQWIHAALNLAAHNGLGLGCVLVGFVLAKIL